MTNDVQILNNGYPMPAVGLGVYKMSRWKRLSVQL